MKKGITIIFVLLFLFAFCACGKNDTEELNKIYEHIDNKSFLFKDSMSSTRYEDPYYTNDGKRHDGGSYEIETFYEWLVTFNADGTVDIKEYGAKKITTYFDEKQKRYADTEDSFSFSDGDVHYDSYFVQRDESRKDKKNYYEIALCNNDTTMMTIGVVLDDEGICRLWSPGYEPGFSVELVETTITTLPSEDYSK